MAALLLNIGPGDEVVVPSYTFVSTVNAFVIRGARPVFVDIRADTLNIDERLIERRLNKRTRAIVPVHYAGVGCEMDAVMEIAERCGVSVVEDNAHGLFARYRGRPLGSFGCLAVQSFHETKNISCGEGGALIVNEERLLERAEILREKGTDRSRFLRGQVDKYTWVDVGSSYVMSDILGAVLLAQLEKREMIQERRRQLWQRYNDELLEWALYRGIRLPYVPTHCDQAFHMFYLLMSTSEDRDRFIHRMRARGVHCVFHYVPLHKSPMGVKMGGKPGQCPVAELVSERIVRLPFYPGMSDDEQGWIIECAKNAGR
jgi:dTDP-4-amino-4,6-dideoxygalactose transaminase